MRLIVPVKKQKPSFIGGGDEAQTLVVELEFVSFKRLNSDLPELPEYTPRQDPDGASVSLLDPNGNVHAFYVINKELSRVTMDHCFDDVDGEFELIFETKEAASE